MSNRTWVHQYSNGQSHTNFEFPVEEAPCAWFACTGPGTVVVAEEDGTNVTYVAVGGEVIRGVFSKLVSNTCQYVTFGNGPPPNAAAQTVGASAATSLDSRVSTDESATTSVVTRFSTQDTTDSSVVTSVTTRFSTSVSTLTSQVVSLTTRVSTAESTEASVH